MSNIYCIGELLIDMICIDNKGLKNGELFEKKPGGAPANVSVAISKLGGSPYFLGQVGDDFFGEFLLDLLNELNVDTSMTCIGGNTTTAFVGIDKKGERNFTFLRGSDGEYKYSSINTSYFSKNDIIHFGSATAFLDSNLKETYFKLLDYAKQNNIYVSFDPNYRENLIRDNDLEQFIDDCKVFLRNSDFVKVSLEELFLITSEKTVEGALEILHNLGVQVITVTLGEKGTLLSVNGVNKIVQTIKINQIDSTGAGDAFVGAVLTQLSNIENRNDISFDKWEEIVRFANKVGAITCTNYGGISAIPTLGELKSLNQ
ncbi:MAG: carbohydrate kinase [Clostridium sp.]|uniref:carbohydrate kinase family protein n=1 Tax=Clostridium sp. TaxID=1506 RepID=UPI00290E29C2|nr:carbohydrate kinase [Clostridium sp.]MDU4937675.1 carbohydrate kinase [Clostridium sp.]